MCSNSIEMLPKVHTEYYADKSGNRIADIPYKEYIDFTQDVNKFNREIAVPDDLNEQNSAEDNARAIQNAVDSLKNGGVIYIPKGIYKTTTVFLKDNITLFISSGAELLSPDYDEVNSTKNKLYKALIYAENAKNIRITGGGTLNGNGVSFTNEPIEHNPLYALKRFNTYTRTIEARRRIRTAKQGERANIIKFSECRGVSIDNIYLKDAAFWTCILDNCVDAQIYNTVIDNHMHVANADGVDITGGENILIENCFIATADDALCLKSIEHEIHGVKIQNCIATSCANCFKIGTETQFDISDIRVSDCKFFMPDGFTYGYAGISIESCDGANISNIHISNIEMNGVSSPLLIWLGNRFKFENNKIGSIDNIYLNNINAVNTEFPCAITGCRDGKVKNVIINNLTSVYRATDENLNIRAKIADESLGGYPEITRVSHIYRDPHEKSDYWDLPCYGAFVRYAESIGYKNIKTTPRNVNTREEFYIEK